MFRTNNPVISRATNSVDLVSVEASYKGVALKTSILIIIAMVAAVLSTSSIVPESFRYGMLGISGIGGFICVIVGCFSATGAKYASWLYAIFEGFLIGTICSLLEVLVPGITIMALSITACVFASMLILYSTKIIRVTSKFKKVFFTAFFSMFFASLILMIFNLVTGGATSGFFNSYGMVLAISVVFCLLASFMLMMDFERIKSVVENKMDKKYEWMLSLGLMVTLVWLFIEVLRLVAIVASRDN